MKLLLCGFGSIGRRHLRNAQTLLPAGATWTIVEPERSAWVSEPGVRFAASLEEAAGEHDVALVCSPTALHAAHIAAIADRVGAIFIEKPLAHDRAALEAIRATLSRRGIPVMVGCNYRFEAGLLEVRRLLVEGAVGRALSVRAEYGQWLPRWRPQQDYRLGYAARRATGGGIVLDRIHELDYVLWLAGPVTDVKAFHGKLSTLEIETEDTAEVLLRFASGAIGSVHVDYLQHEYVCALKIIGERGTIEWRFRPTVVRVVREDGAAQIAYEDATPDVNAMYVAELRHFFDCVRTGAPPTNGLDEAATTLETALAVLEAR